MNQIYLLTDAQRRIWYTESFFTHTGVSNLVAKTKLKDWDHSLLEQSIEIFVTHFEMMRARLLLQEGKEPVQYISKESSVKLSIVDISEYKAEQVKDWFQNQAKVPFFLYDSRLYDFQVVKWEKDVFLFMRCHHILFDGISGNLIVKKIQEIYEGLQQGISLDLGNPYKFNQYHRSAEEYLASVRFQKDEKFWFGEFERISDTHMTQVEELYRKSLLANRKEWVVPSDFKQQIELFCQQHKISIYTLFMSALFLYYSRVQNEKEVVLGTYFANRKHNEREAMGMFVSTLPFRMEIGQDFTVIEWLRQVNLKQMKLLRHQKYPYNRLIQQLRQKGHDVKQLFTIGVEYQEFTAGDSEQIFNGYDFNEISVHIKNYKARNQLVFNIDYRQEIHQAREMEQLIQHVMTLVEDMIQHPSKDIAQLEMCTKSEKHQLLMAWNKTSVPFPRDRTIHELFEEQVVKDPNKIAIVYKNEKWTYQQINEQANQIAYLLRQRGVKPNNRVGILMERSLDLIVGILAILKSGGAYVPIDPEYPVERIRFMLEDCGAKLVLSQTEILKKCESEFNHSCEWLDVQKLALEGIESTNLSLENRSSDLAYVIYTSGTTGKPKGVKVAHRSVLRLVKKANYADLNEDQVFLQLAPMTFDASTFEVWGCLLNGAKLVLMESNRPSIKEIAIALKTRQITILWLTAGLFKLMVEYDLSSMKNLRQLLVGGDVVSASHVQKVLDLGGVEVINGYGPTENTTFTCCYSLPSNWNGKGSLPIGRPISNTKVYILDLHQQPVPIGVPGELYVAGDGLAQGYLNQEELTDKKFLPNPFIPNEKMYRTGDLTRYLPDGNIEFLGRMDHQVKVRGHRIEPSEIESVLLTHSQVKDAIVCDWKDEQNGTYLCAYMVADKFVSTNELREYLSQKLPSYMIPSFFMKIDQIPLTPNGKVDRKALPKTECVEVQTEYIPPVTDLEKKLVKIWEEVLQVKNVGVTNHFFELGGDSIKAIQVAALLEKENLTLRINHLFRAPTIQKLIPFIEKRKKQTASQANIQGEVPLTPIQSQFFERDNLDLHHFNQAMLLFCPTRLQEKIIQKVCMKLIEHHDALRMIYLQRQDQWIQINQGVMEGFSMDTIDLQHINNPLDAIAKFSDQAQASLNINHGPLMKVCHFKTGNGEYLLFVIHHLVIDGVSWRILLEDFESGYQQALQQKNIQLPLKTDAYLDWAKGLQKYANSTNIQKERKYWEEICKTELLPIPKDYEAERSLWRDCDEIEISLTKEETKKLLSKIHHAYNTEINDILLIALGLTLRDWIGADQVGFTLEGHGREEVLDQLSVHRTVGWFTSCYPVVLDFSNPTSEEFLSYGIKKVKETLRRIPNRGIGFGILGYLGQDKKLSENLATFRPEVVFNYLGQFDRSSEKNNLFQISSSDIGRMVSPQMERTYALEMNGLVIKEEFILRISYSSREYNRETISTLAHNLKHRLKNVISYCYHKIETEKTPSDFGNKTLSFQELEHIKNLFEVN
jgi:amino acid adenylation domain-containing protein/non-ribosomal peptide synthase protein (TIGR01720 family)